MKPAKASTIEVRNPYNGELVGSVLKSSAKDIHGAVQRAQAAFRKNRGMSSFARRRILRKVFELLAAQKDDFAKLITRETGKPITDTRQEITRALFVLEQTAEEVLRISGSIFTCDVTERETDKKCFTYHKPLGVIAAITPFNFPLNIPAHKVAPAIAAGNAVILKPSPLAPLTAEKFRQLFIAASLPDDLFQIVHGHKEEVELLCAADVNMISLTGGIAAGEAAARAAGMKKLSLELGDNGALMVFDDADLEAAVKVCIEQRFRIAGQRCTGVKRVFVQRGVYAQFVRQLCAEAKKMKSGDTLDARTDIGPLISENAAVLVEQRINAAVRHGAKILLGGKRQGSVIEPTVVEKVPESSELACEETFGPVLPVFAFGSVDELIKKVNASKFGLQAGVFTNQLDVAKRLAKEIEVVTLAVNEGPGFRIESIPFGGMKQSGFGREGVRSAIEEMSQTVNLIF